MRLGKGKKRALAWLGSAIAVLLILLLACPLWFPWVLQPLAASHGLHFANYTRESYTRFALNEVSFTNQNLQVTAKKADLLVPTIWTWRSFGASKADRSNFARIDGWKLKFVSQTESAPNAKSSTSPYAVVIEVRKVANALRRWLPSADLSNGEILFNTNSILLSTISWKAGQLGAKAELPAQKQTATIAANLTSVPYQAQVRSETAHADIHVDLETTAAGMTLVLAGNWQTNAFHGQAHFNKEDPLPETAELVAEHFRIPASLLGFQEYDQITGGAQAAWTNGRFTCAVVANGSPLPQSTNLPSIDVNIRAEGDTNVAVIQSATVSLPWMQLRASPQTRLHFHGPLLQESTELSVGVNLDRQPWIPLHGILHGNAKLEPGGKKYPTVAVNFIGTNVGNAQIDAARVSLAATAQWPEINIERLQAVLDDSSSLNATGAINADLKTVTNGNVSFHGRAAARWLPAGYAYDDCRLSLQFSGPATNLLHQGHLAVSNLLAPGTAPMQVRLDWSGRQTSFDRATAGITAADNQIDTVLSVALHPPPNTNSPFSIDANVGSFSWKHAATPVFALTEPAHLTFESAHSATIGWHATIERMDLQGTGGQLQLAGAVDWPDQGTFRLSAANVDSQTFASVLHARLEPTLLQNLFVSGGWTNGPLVFDLRAAAQTKLQTRPVAAGQETNRLLANLADLGALSLNIAAHGNAQGIALTNFSLQSQTSSIAVAHGFVPIAIAPADGTNFLRIDSKAPAAFSMRTEPRSVFWAKFAEWTGVTLREPSVRAEVTGTWEHPRGIVRITAAEIKLPKDRFPVLDLQALDVNIGLDRDNAILTNLSLLVQKQPVIASGRMPLGESFWTDLKERKTPKTFAGPVPSPGAVVIPSPGGLLEKASGRLLINDAQIAAFSALFPEILAPQGSFHLDVALDPGGKLSGQLTLREARTRPFPGLGPIRDIDVTMQFTERQVKLAAADVTIGGSSVRAAGTVDLRGSEWLRRVPPPFEFTLSGSNVPLSRQPESIIRGDLKISAKKTNGAPPLISGLVRLHNSYYLSDLADLVPSKMASPEQRPPYFSVTETNLADWRLALRVSGERGVRVRSTLFSGEVSPNLRLQGTLKEPVALGDVKIDSGTVKFPFGNLDVQRGFVSLTSENPYRPQLNVSAASKKFGYDVRMQLTGPADQPVIQFSSTPPLSSEQLVLMLTAGELPKTGYTLTPSQRAQTMALFFGKDLLGKLGFGDQSEDRITFSSGQEISETGKPTYSLEYKLADRWSLVGEYDRFNAFNAGVKWKVYSR